MSKKNQPETVSLSKLYENRKASTETPASIEKKVFARVKSSDEKTNRRYRFIAEAIVGVIIFIIVLPHGLQVNNQPAVERMSVTEMLATVQEAKPKVSEQLAAAPSAKEAQPVTERNTSIVVQADAVMTEAEPTAESTNNSSSNFSTVVSSEVKQPKQEILFVIDGAVGLFRNCDGEEVTLDVETKLSGWIKASQNNQKTWRLEQADAPTNCAPELSQ